jgi:hypothetical protein
LPSISSKALPMPRPPQALPRFPFR